MQSIRARWHLVALLLVWGAWLTTIGVLLRHLDLWAPHAPPLARQRLSSWLSTAIVGLTAWAWLHSVLPSLASAARISMTRLTAAFAAVALAGALLGLEIATTPIGPLPPIDESRIEGLVTIHFTLGILGATLLLLVPGRVSSTCGPIFLFSSHSSDRAARVAWLTLFGQGFFLGHWWLMIPDRQAVLLGGSAPLLGLGFAAWQRYPQRALGFVPLGWSLALIASFGRAISPGASWPLPWFGFGLGLSLAAPQAEILTRIHPSRRFLSSALMAAALTIGGVVGGVGLGFVPSEDVRRLIVAIVALVMTMWAVWALCREMLELLVEPLLALMYRVRAVGSGADQMPTRGPMVIIANHAAWFDPLWIAKVVPVRVRPMMTARFFDLPCLSWLMRKVFFTIRVPEARFRREAPEIQVAIAGIDAGDNVLIFPEGWLRRREEQSLRRFGHGIHQILSSRPQTPVIACWIEGGWGSFVSYKNGPPTKNKPLDIRRPIRIGISEPVFVPAEVLADHWQTRRYLMAAVLRARTHLGLPELPLPFPDAVPDDSHPDSNHEVPQDTSSSPL